MPSIRLVFLLVLAAKLRYADAHSLLEENRCIKSGIFLAACKGGAYMLEAPATPPAVYPVWMPTRVLLIDDLLFDVILTRTALRDCEVELEVVTACDGAEALLQLREARFDLILLDIKMPRVDGFEVLKQLRSTPSLSHIPVVIISGSNIEADRTRAEALGAFGYVQKAMEYQDFQQNLQRALLPHGFC